jgi:cytidine deaminase
VSDIDWDALIEAALEVRLRAYAPYSNYLVGAALLGADGTVYVGCNVENAAFPVCICAERSALVAAVSAGCREFQALVVATTGDPPAAPCGVCRQALNEFAPELPIQLVTSGRTSTQLYLPDLFGEPTPRREQLSLAQLLPRSFGPSNLDDTE